MGGEVGLVSRLVRPECAYFEGRRERVAGPAEACRPSCGQWLPISLRVWHARVLWLGEAWLLAWGAAGR